MDPAKTFTCLLLEVFIRSDVLELVRMVVQFMLQRILLSEQFLLALQLCRHGGLMIHARDERVCSGDRQCKNFKPTELESVLLFSHGSRSFLCSLRTVVSARPFAEGSRRIVHGSSMVNAFSPYFNPFLMNGRVFFPIL